MAAGCRERQRMSIQYKHVHTHNLKCVHGRSCIFLTVLACVCVCLHKGVCVRQGPAAQDLLSLSS